MKVSFIAWKLSTIFKSDLIFSSFFTAMCQLYFYFFALRNFINTKELVIYSLVDSLLFFRLRGYESLVDIVVATPGRLVDHVNQTEGFNLGHLRYLVNLNNSFIVLYSSQFEYMWKLKYSCRDLWRILIKKNISRLHLRQCLMALKCIVKKKHMNMRS